MWTTALALLAHAVIGEPSGASMHPRAALKSDDRELSMQPRGPARGPWGAMPTTSMEATPSWPPTYNITRSTIIMPCNLSGYFDYSIAGQFAIVDYVRTFLRCAFSCSDAPPLGAGLVKRQGDVGEPTEVGRRPRGGRQDGL